MKLLQGFKTIAFNIAAISTIWLNSEYGIQLPEEYQTPVIVTIVSLANIILRIFTKTPIKFKHIQKTQETQQDLK